MINLNLLKHGDKALFHRKGFSPFSAGIRMLTGSYWNHIGQLVLLDQKWYLIEAIGSGVTINPLELYLNPKTFDIKIVRLKIESFKSSEEYHKGIKTSTTRLYEQVGKKYDWSAIFYLGFKYLFKGIFKKVLPKGNPFHTREEFYCAESICEADFEISSINPRLYKGKTNQTCSTTTPKDIGKTQHVDFITGLNKL